MPPVWSELEQRKFLGCALRAGMSEAKRVSEAEALAQTFLRHKPIIQVSMFTEEAKAENSFRSLTARRSVCLG